MNEHRTNNRRNQPTDSTLEYAFGKVQPQTIELEQAVLGAVMLDREALPAVMDILKAESFYTEAHQNIYQAAIGLYNGNNPVDILTVTEALRKSGQLEKIGGGYYLIELSNRVASSANIEYHARIVQQKFYQREYIRVGTQIVREAYEDTTDVFEMMESAEKNILAITAGQSGADARSAGSISVDVLKGAEAAMKRKLEGGVSGVPSGFQCLDVVTGGFQVPDLIIVAGRPGSGKSSLAMNIAENAARAGYAAAIFSLEMSSAQLMARVMAGQSGVSSSRMANGSLHDSDLLLIQDAATANEGVPIYIDDTPAISLFSLRAKARRLKMKHGIKLLVVDYIQLMTYEGDKRNSSREQDVSAISRGLKGIAKELNVPVIALSQLSRAVETRGGSKRPMLSDLRDSGAIEQDADIVAFIYRPEYYGITEDDKGKSLKGVAEIIFAKYRNGGPGTVYLHFEDTFARFSDPKGGTQFPAAKASQSDLPF